MRLNHVLVLTNDLAGMEEFWSGVIGLSPGPRPDFPFPGAWFYAEGKPAIHVAEASRPPGLGSIAHVALEGADYGEALARLRRHAADFTERVVPGTQDRQVFVSGPDRLVVELLFESSRA